MKNWKVVLGILLVFLLGCLAGALVVHIVYKQKIEQVARGGPQAFGDIIASRLNRELRLDSAQKEQVRAIVRDAVSEAVAVRKRFRPQMDQIREGAEQKLRALLRDEQREKFDRILARQRALRATRGF